MESRRQDARLVGPANLALLFKHLHEQLSAASKMLVVVVIKPDNASAGGLVPRWVCRLGATELPSIFSERTGMRMSHEDQEQRALHANAVAALAAELELPVSEVQRVYEVHFSRLRSQATVHDYLVLLVSRRVRDELRH
jgi:hypothetical protein